MRRILILVVLIFAGILSFAQLSSSADSLKKALDNYRAEDSTRLNLLLNFSGLSKNTPAGNEAIEQAITLAQKLKLNNKLGEAYLLKGAVLLSQGDDTLAYNLINESLNIFKELKNEEGQGKAFRSMARVFQFRSDYYAAIEYNIKAQAVFEKIRNNELAGNANMDIGVCYYYLSDYVTANQYYLEAKKHFEKNNNQVLLASTFSNLAMVSRKQEKYKTAIDYYRTSLSLQDKLKDSGGIAKSLQGIAIVHDLMQKSDSAIWYYNEALVINRKKNFKLSIAENITNMAITFKDINQYSKAFALFNEADKMFRELKRESNIYTSQLNVAELFVNAPDSFFYNQKIPAGERYTRAVSLLKGTISYCQSAGELSVELSAWEVLCIAYEKQGNYKEAYTALSKVLVLKDSILNEEKIEATTMQTAKAEYDKKEAVLNAVHDTELKHQQTIKYALMGGAGLLLLGGAFSFFFYKRKRDAQSRQKEAELKAEVTDTEMKVMRLQMNPHFIFNSLNSISDYIAKNNPKEADDYLSKFAKVMRMTLENSEQQAISLSDDLKALELYMQLEAKRLNNKFTYEIKVTGDIDKDNTLVPPMIFQPFVENSIWHGIAKKEGQGHIIIDISKEGEMLNCRIDDDGIGRKQAESMKVQQEDKKQSLGMRITKARIEILNKLKGSNATVQLVDKPQGVTAELKLPIERNF